MIQQIRRYLSNLLHKLLILSVKYKSIYKTNRHNLSNNRSQRPLKTLLRFCFLFKVLKVFEQATGPNKISRRNNKNHSLISREKFVADPPKISNIYSVINHETTCRFSI